MRRSYIFLALIFVIMAAVFLFPLFSQTAVDDLVSWGIIATVLVILAIIAFFFEFEAAALGSREIALVAMLGTIAAVSRVPFAVIPSVQPCTYLIICTGYVFGPVAGFMVGAVTALVSNFFLGQGPWTPYQMFAWGLVGISAAYLRYLRPGRLALSLFGAAWGYLYGWTVNLWFWVSFIYPLTARTFFLYQLNSVWFDTFHAIGNFIFLWFFALKTIAILERFKQRFSWTKMESGQAAML
jgi:energy-coupling factor transport system substrate-specific component